MIPPKTLSSQGYATWLPAMMDCLLRTRGPVLEVGGGLWSPVLHAFCDRIRMLTTVETDPEWYGLMLSLANPWHLVYAELPAGCSWDVALVDGPTAERQPMIEALRGRAKYIVVHDTQDGGYGWDFKGYTVSEWASLSPATSVLSAVTDTPPTSEPAAAGQTDLASESARGTPLSASPPAAE